MPSRAAKSASAWSASAVISASFTSTPDMSTESSRDAGASGGLRTLFFDHFVHAIQCVAGAADLGDHA